jgi:hypothetical protein
MSLLDRVQRKAEGDVARSPQRSSESAAPAETGPPAPGRTAYGATSVLIAAFCV